MGVGDDDPEGERATLVGFLDRYRTVVENKVAGLSRDEATRVATPTGLTLLGLVNHLAWVERRWFVHNFTGAEPETSTHAESFHPGASDTVDAVVERYRTACAEARAIVDAAPSLDVRSQLDHHVYGTRPLRWILGHMVEETARHVGHLDVLRELTDGATGD